MAQSDRTGIPKHSTSCMGPEVQACHLSDSRHGWEYIKEKLIFCLFRTWIKPESFLTSETALGIYQLYHKDKLFLYDRMALAAKKKQISLSLYV